MSGGEEKRADPATLFAAERTLLAWIRTGLSLMGFGFALARFGLYLREASPAVASRSPHFSVVVGIVLVAFGVVAMLLAVVGHAGVIRRLKAGERAFPARPSLAVLLAGALALLGIAGCVYLLYL